jgi:hypothetical protein
MIHSMNFRTTKQNFYRKFVVMGGGSLYSCNRINDYCTLLQLNILYCRLMLVSALNLLPRDGSDTHLEGKVWVAVRALPRRGSAVPEAFLKPARS